MKLEEEISKYLKENGITQTFVSQRTGIPLPKLNMSLKGHRRISCLEYALICGALEVNTDFFLKPIRYDASAGKG